MRHNFQGKVMKLRWFFYRIQSISKLCLTVRQLIGKGNTYIFFEIFTLPIYHYSFLICGCGVVREWLWLCLFIFCLHYPLLLTASMVEIIVWNSFKRSGNRSERNISKTLNLSFEVIAHMITYFCVTMSWAWLLFCMQWSDF